MSAHNFVDLTGKRFDMLTVLEFNKDTQKWKCQCDCGNITYKKAGHLHINGRFQSCGCKNKMTFIDITGQRFGNLVAIEYDKEIKKWKCQCDCGNIVYKRSGHLREGLVTRCSNNCGINNKLVDLRGQRFGKLKVIEYNKQEKKWRCICDCGREHMALSCNLRNGSVQSCGKCISNAFVDIKGQKFNKLTAIEYNGSGIWKCLCDCGNICYKNSYDLRERGALSCGCITNISDKEQKLREYIKNIYKGNIVFNDRNILNGRELDIYIPDKNLAFEFNGNYWHSLKDKNYHQQKTLECIENKIRLIHIFEYEWDNNDKQNKIKSYIKDIICNSSKIYARQTIIREINSEVACKFINENHLQGYVVSDINIGCYYNNEIIGIMTFGSPHFNNNYQYELIRLCWKSGYSIVGGSNKLFKYFINKYNPESIICYSDLAKFRGTVYKDLGFRLIDITKPNYVWVSHHDNKVLSRYQTQKHKLIKNGLGNINDTEDSIMISLGYYKIYDCGNLKFEWIRNNTDN